MRNAWLVTILLLGALILAGCADSRSVLLSGISPDARGAKIVIDDATASRDARGIERKWLTEIGQRARTTPGERFVNPSTSQFRQRLAAAATRYGFTVKSLRFLRPRQLAPLSVVQTTHYVDLARDFRLMDKTLNPLKERRTDGLDGAFEGFFFEAQDEHGVPFFVIDDAIRGPHGGGGEWARAEALFPFSHG